MLFLLTWAALCAGPLELNTATVEQLEQLPGLGPAKAATIVQWRETHGAFASLDDLLRVPHIGPGTLANLRRELTVAVEPTEVAPNEPKRVNINTAGETELVTLEGIGPLEAAAIISGRPFETCWDLTRLTGLGPATVANLADHCTAL